MIQMKEIHEELREIRGHKTEQATAVTTTTRVTGRWEACYADQTRRFLEAQWSRMTLKIIRRRAAFLQVLRRSPLAWLPTHQ